MLTSVGQLSHGMLGVLLEYGKRLRVEDLSLVFAPRNWHFWALDPAPYRCCQNDGERN